MLQEAAIRCDSGAGADHDDVARGIGGQAEPLVRLDENPAARVIAFEAREVRGRRTETTLSIELVVYDRDRHVNLVADRLAARRDRVEPRCQRTQRLDERVRIPRAGMTPKDIDDLQVLERSAQVVLVSGLEHGRERSVECTLRM